MKPDRTFLIVIASIAATFLCIIGPCMDQGDDITHTYTAQQKIELIQKLKKSPGDFVVYSILEDMNGRTDIVAEDEKIKVVYREDKLGKFLTIRKQKPQQNP
ncbi:MAG: hypothetical protein JWP09_917 [Candidatus Taylorbacteria bacterium]|nr:hypothetical protein [Candidatus Taylorbacteria bacterium]